jgi:arylsulfatase A
LAGGNAGGGAVSPALIDFTDFYATFAQIAGAPLPTTLSIDSRSFAPLLRSPGAAARSWVFVQLGGEWYVRDTRWKLTGRGELCDLSDAPFTERPVPAGSGGAEAPAARASLQTVLNELSPHGDREKIGPVGAGD